MQTRLAAFLIRLYPRSWRERYGDEMLALVQDAGLSPRAVMDLVWHCGGAWARQALGQRPLGPAVGDPTWADAIATVPRPRPQEVLRDVVVFVICIAAVSVIGSAFAALLGQLISVNFSRELADIAASWLLVAAFVAITVYGLLDYLAWYRRPLTGLLVYTAARPRRHWEIVTLVGLAVTCSTTLRLVGVVPAAGESWLASILFGQDALRNLLFLAAAFPSHLWAYEQRAVA